MKTVPLPFAAVHMFGPQHAACTPVSVTRRAGRKFILTSADPLMAGPTAGWGQAGHPCPSAGTWDKSDNRPAGGILSSFRTIITPSSQFSNKTLLLYGVQALAWPDLVHHFINTMMYLPRFVRAP